MLATRRLYLTLDRRQLVEEDDPRAALLYAIPGDVIPDDEARRLGLIKPKLPAPPQPDPSSEPEPESAAKALDPVEDKALLGPRRRKATPPAKGGA